MPLQLIKPDSRGVRLNQVKQGFLCQNIRLYQVLECIWSVQSWERRACCSIRNVAPFWGMHFIAFWHRDVSEPSEYQSFCVFVPMELQCKWARESEWELVGDQTLSAHLRDLSGESKDWVWPRALRPLWKILFPSSELFRASSSVFLRIQMRWRPSQDTIKETQGFAAYRQ